ncbi:uncharacterized protein METZ01_LOCUS429923 [marine metagenome]|uniref:Thioredoxin domain-containing protein n=1 Tax=marine metagenome TaxID=408172 RepID=A0A382Y1Z9_9ZZZZ
MKKLSSIILIITFTLSGINSQTDDLNQAKLIKGDLAPNWVLLYAPGKFEFLKNWTVERDKQLRKPSKQPDRHVVVITFFASWCPPCIEQLKPLENVFQKYKDVKVKFFIVDLTEATRNTSGFEDAPTTGPLLMKEGITIPILYDNRGWAAKNYEATSIPKLFVIDKFQIIREVRKGFNETEDLQGDLSKIIDQLLVEK